MLSTLPVEELCRKLKPVFGEKIEQIYLKYSLTTDRDSREEIEKTLNALYHKHLNESFLQDKILLEPPPEHKIDGTYPLGSVVYADKTLYPFFMREKDWIRHVCVCGMSGSGKTNFAFQMLGGFILKEKPFIAFDWKKSFRSLMQVDKRLMCFTIGNERVSNFFRININRPPKGVGPKEWINLLTDIITECYFASYGVHKIILETLDEAFRDFGVYKGSENYPTWRQIKDRLEEKSESSSGKSNRESEWVASALRIAHSLTFGSFGDTVNYKGKDILSVEELMKNKVIFELDSLNNSEKKFFCEYILVYIYKMMKALQNTHTSDFNYAILVDEAHNIFLKDNSKFLKESVTDMVYREIREYGIGLICLDQHISKLSEVVAGNSACCIGFQQVLPHDIDTVSYLMQMWERKKYFSMLPVGYAIVKLAERHHEPFLIKVPLAELKHRNVGDDYIQKEMKERTTEYRRLNLFYDSVRTDRIASQLEKLDRVYKRSDVDTTPDFVKQEFVRKREFMAQAQEINDDVFIDSQRKKNEEARKAGKPKPILNQFQRELIPYVTELLGRGLDIRAVKERLLEEEYKRQDILVAISHADVKKKAGEQKKFINEYKVSHKNIDYSSVVHPVLQNGAASSHITSSHKDISVSHSHIIHPSTAETDFLKSLQHSELSVSEIYQTLGLSARKGNEIKKKLVFEGLVEVEEIRNDRGWRKVLRLTDRGKSKVSI